MEGGIIEQEKKMPIQMTFEEKRIKQRQELIKKYDHPLVKEKIINVIRGGKELQKIDVDEIDNIYFKNFIDTKERLKETITYNDLNNYYYNIDGEIILKFNEIINSERADLASKEELKKLEDLKSNIIKYAKERQKIGLNPSIESLNELSNIIDILLSSDLKPENKERLLKIIGLIEPASLIYQDGQFKEMTKSFFSPLMLDLRDLIKNKDIAGIMSHQYTKNTLMLLASGVVIIALGAGLKESIRYIILVVTDEAQKEIKYKIKKKSMNNN